MKLEFLLQIWDKDTEELLKEVLSNSVHPDDIRHLLTDVIEDDHELIAAVYDVPRNSEAQIAKMFGVEQVNGDYQLSRVRL